MSRRTKFLITALLLVLMGIPALYVILTWAPANPLRVRMDTSLPLEDEAPDEGINILTAHVVVENTGNTPIHLLSLYYEPDFPSLPARVSPTPLHPHGPAGSFHWGQEIPAHATVPMKVYVPVQYVGAVHTGNFTAEYSYISRTKGWLIKACLWIDDHLPEILRHRMPSFGSQKGILLIAVPEDNAPQEATRTP